MTDQKYGELTDPDHEILHGHEAYTDAELLEQAQANAQALILAVFGAIGDDTERLVEGVANAFLRLWDTEREWEAAEVLDALLTNFRALGATVASVDLVGSTPTAELTDVPLEDLPDLLGVPASAFQPMFAISTRIAARLGWHLDWRVTGESAWSLRVSAAP